MTRKLTFCVLLTILLVSLSMAQNTPVKFQVKMSIQMLLGNFNPATDSLTVRGTFNGWSGFNPLLTEGAVTDSIYEATVALPDSLAGTTIEYKYVIRHAGQDFWETLSSRTYQVPSGGGVIPVVYYDDRTSIGVTAHILFQVDMRVQMAIGAFVPDSGDQVLVRGSFNGWGESSVMTPSTIHSGVWEYDATLTMNPGDTIEYKYYIKTSRTSGKLPSNGGWEGGSNYKVGFTGSDIIVPLRFWDNVDFSTILANDVHVIFQVLMKGAKNYQSPNHDQPFPSIDSVFIAGAQEPLFWLWDHSNWDRSQLKFYDDGTHGDLTAGDSIYARDILFKKNTTKVIEYKYSVAYHPGQASFPEDNEAGFQQNHLADIIDGVSRIRMTVDTFGVWQTRTKVLTGVGEVLTALPRSYSLEQNYPNPFNPTTAIQYTVPVRSAVTITLYNVLGKEIATYVNKEQEAGTYKLIIDGSYLPSGVYFYQMRAGNFVDTKKMMLLK